MATINANTRINVAPKRKPVTGPASKVDPGKFAVGETYKHVPNKGDRAHRTVTRTPAGSPENYALWLQKSVTDFVAPERFVDSVYVKCPSPLKEDSVDVILPPTDCIVSSFDTVHCLSTAVAYVLQSRGLHLKQISVAVPEANYLWAKIGPFGFSPSNENTFAEQLYSASMIIYKTFVRHLCYATQLSIYPRIINAIRELRRKILETPLYSDLVKHVITHGGKATWYEIFNEACKLPVNITFTTYYVENPTTRSRIDNLKSRVEIETTSVSATEPLTATEPCIATRILGTDAESVFKGVERIVKETLDETHQHEWEHYSLEYMCPPPVDSAVTAPRQVSHVLSSAVLDQCKVYSSIQRYQTPTNTAFVTAVLWFAKQSTVPECDLVIRDMPARPSKPRKVVAAATAEADADATAEADADATAEADADATAEADADATAEADADATAEATAEATA